MSTKLPECYTTEPQARCLRVEISPGRALLLPLDQFAFAEFTNDEKRDGSWTVPERKSITLRYRVVIYDGTFTPAQLADMYNLYSDKK